MPPDEPADSPDCRLLLAAGLLIVFPQSDWLIDLADVIDTDVIDLPFWGLYVAWIVVDLLIVTSLFVSVRMYAAAKKFLY